MADETSQPNTGTDAQGSGPQGADAGAAPTVEELTARVADLQAQLDKAKAEGRKHEDREKANRDKAKRADDLEAQAATQADRLKALESENARLKADADKAQHEREVADLHARVAASHGIPDPTLLAGESEEDAEASAARILAAFKAMASRGNVADSAARGATPRARTSGADDFARAMSRVFGS